MTETRARSTRSTRRRLDRAPAARRHRAFARRGATIETRRRVGRTRARLSALARNHPWMDAVHLATAPRALASSVARPRRRANATTPRLARARRARVGPPRRETRGWREGRERERDGTARANDARGRGSASATSRDANFFCARRVTRPAAARDDRRAGTDGRAARTRTRMCDFELIRSIAIVRRARRCASPPRARL